jgi:hypothetical protein
LRFWTDSIAEQQHTRRLFLTRVLVRAHRAIEELVLVEVDIEERRPVLNLPGDKRLSKPLQTPPHP